MICQICAKDKVNEVKVANSNDRSVWLCDECAQAWLDAEASCIEAAQRVGIDDEGKKALIVPTMAAIFKGHQADECVNTIIASICRKIRPYFTNRSNLFGQFTKPVKEYRQANFGYIPRYNNGQN